jgi:hypothetical protein
MDRDSSPQTPLIYASKEGHLETVQALVRLGARVSPAPGEQPTHTALRGAAIFGHSAVVRFLLGANADPNQLSAGGKTSLMGACMRGHDDVARVLIGAGASALLCNSMNETAADLARAGGHARCLRALEEAGPLACPPPELDVSAGGGDDDVNGGSSPQEGHAPSPLSPRQLLDTVRTRASSTGALRRLHSAVRRQILLRRSITALTEGVGKARRRSFVALRERTQAAQLRLQERQEISTAQLYLLTAGTSLGILVVIYALVMAALKLLHRVHFMNFFSQSAQLDDFRAWTMEVCIDEWAKETVLCQAKEGNWLARQLIRAKLHEREADHCDPDSFPGGCRHAPCPSEGLSRVLLNLADGFTSPLNSYFHPLYYVLLPIRDKLKALCRGLAHGTLPLSALDREIAKIPILDKKLPFSRSGRTTTSILLEDLVYPRIHKWGAVIAHGGRSRAPKECPVNSEMPAEMARAVKARRRARAPPWKRRREAAEQLAEVILPGVTLGLL